MRDVATIPALAVALEHFEASDHFKRMLQNAQAIAGHELFPIESAGAASRQACEVVIEDALLDGGRDDFIGIARGQQHCEVLGRGRHQRVLKIYNSNSRAMLDVQIFTVVIAVGEYAREAMESRGHHLEFGCDCRKISAGCDSGQANFRKFLQLPLEELAAVRNLAGDTSIIDLGGSFNVNAE